MKNAIIILTLLVSIPGIRAQEDSTQTEPKLIWSLEECINYAMENSLEVQQKLVDVYYNELQLKQAKWDRTGSLSGTMNGGRSFGRAVDPSSNTYLDVSSWSYSTGVSYGINLFNGFRLNNLVQMREKALNATQQELESMKEDIALQVAFAYLDAIYSKELVKVAQAQIEVSKNELERTQARYEAGDAGKDQYLEGQAQLAREESNLAQAEVDVTYNLLLLSQLLNMDTYEGFDIIVPVTEDIKAQISILSARDLFNESVNNRPNIMAAQLRIQSEVENLQATKANYYPNISLGASYNTDFNDQSRDPLTGNQISFWNQLDNNRRAYFGARLTIPIFDRLSVRNSVKMQELAIDNREFELDLAKRNYRETIQKAYNDALANQKKFTAAKKVAEASQSSFDFAQEKYSYGAMNVFDFNTSKNNLTKAEVELLQAKYQFIFAAKVLDFYRGIPLDL